MYTFSNCIERKHEAILDYFYYNPIETPEHPEWMKQAMVDKETEDIIFSVEESKDKHVVSIGNFAVYNPVTHDVSVMEMEEFCDSYQRVEA